MTFTRRRILVHALSAPAIVTSVRLGSAAPMRTLKLTHPFRLSTVDGGDMRDRLCRQFAASVGTRTGGDPRNRDYLAGNLDSAAAVEYEALCFDPQTSGGLLAAVTPDAASTLAAAGWWRVGTVEAGEPRLVLA